MKARSSQSNELIKKKKKKTLITLFQHDQFIMIRATLKSLSNKTDDCCTHSLAEFNFDKGLILKMRYAG